MYLHSTSYTLKVIIFLSSQERVSNDMPSWEERFVRRKLCSPQKVIFFIDRKNDIVFYLDYYIFYDIKLVKARITSVDIAKECVDT